MITWSRTQTAWLWCGSFGSAQSWSRGFKAAAHTFTHNVKVSMSGKIWMWNTVLLTCCCEILEVKDMSSVVQYQTFQLWIFWHSCWTFFYGQESASLKMEVYGTCLWDGRWTFMEKASMWKEKKIQNRRLRKQEAEQDLQSALRKKPKCFPCRYSCTASMPVWPIGQISCRTIGFLSCYLQLMKKCTVA